MQPAQHLALLSTVLHPEAPAPIFLLIFISTPLPHWSVAAAHSPVHGEEGPRGGGVWYVCVLVLKPCAANGARRCFIVLTLLG